MPLNSELSKSIFHTRLSQQSPNEKRTKSYERSSPTIIPLHTPPTIRLNHTKKKKKITKPSNIFYLNISSKNKKEKKLCKRFPACKILTFLRFRERVRSPSRFPDERALAKTCPRETPRNNSSTEKSQQPSRFRNTDECSPHTHPYHTHYHERSTNAQIVAPTRIHAVRPPHTYARTHLCVPVCVTYIHGLHPYEMRVRTSAHTGVEA